jgi:hypothetical protein
MMQQRLVVALFVLVAASCQTLHTKSKTRDPGAVEQVEFYIGGAFRPAPKYQVKSFRAANTSQDLASRFRGLALHDDLKSGEYQYALEPVDTAAYPVSQYGLKGSVHLWGPDNWITLQMPDDPVGECNRYPRGTIPNPFGFACRT